MGIRIKEIRNYNTPTAITGPLRPVAPLQGGQALAPQIKHNLSRYISPVQLLRLKHDVKMWRDAVTEAELAFFPHRVKLQRMFIDTALNGHVKACVLKRKRMTTLRRFELFNAAGEVLTDATQALAEMEWFDKFQNYALDAIFYGYSLVALGDIIGNDLKDLSIVPRWNVSPDRYNVTSFVYAINGQDFRSPEVADWHIYVDTPSDNGTSPCGYGLFYNVGLYEIFLRNVLGYNGDFVERFAMPYVHAKTMKTNEDERAELEKAVQQMGANGYALTDPTDDIEFLEAALAGTGWNGYDNLEQRCEKKISKLVLGHADAMESTPGKLGSDQGGDKSPAHKSLSEIQIEDGRKMERVINQQLFPSLARLGLMPKGIKLRYKNDDEVHETTERENNNAAQLAGIAKTMKDAGMKMDAGFFTERTGFPATDVEV